MGSAVSSAPLEATSPGSISQAGTAAGALSVPNQNGDLTSPALFKLELLPNPVTSAFFACARRLCVRETFAAPWVGSSLYTMGCGRENIAMEDIECDTLCVGRGGGGVVLCVVIEVRHIMRDRGDGKLESASQIEMIRASLWTITHLASKVTSSADPALCPNYHPPHFPPSLPLHSLPTLPPFSPPAH